jgi:WD40 repeat protein
VSAEIDMILPAFGTLEANNNSSANGETVDMSGTVGASVDLRGHKRLVSGTAWHPIPGTKVMLSTSFDGTIKLWATPDTDLQQFVTKGK